MSSLFYTVSWAAAAAVSLGITGCAPRGGGTNPPIPPCEGKVGPIPFDGVRELDVDGTVREALFHVPASVDPNRPTSLHLSFHGAGATALAQAALTKFDGLADSEGSIVVYPQALKIADTFLWQPLGEEDIAFVDALLSDIEATWCVDPRRVYASGISNGAVFTYRMACERAQLFAAVAPDAGGPLPPRCEPSRPVPAIIFQGDADQLVPPDSTARAAESFSLLNACTSEETRIDGCVLHTGCAEGADVLFCMIPGMPHVAWPGGFGNEGGPVDGTAEVGAFFASHPMPD